MLNLRIVRGPLPKAANEAILSEYNRLAPAKIPMGEFLHWVQEGPEGPAWHAILESDEGEIVGHQSLIPFRANCNGQKIVAAKSEYTFLRDEFQSTKIRGLEQSNRPKHLIASKKLLDHCQAQGWEPILISTLPSLFRLASSIGCHAVRVGLWECLLVLRPWKAASNTPNVNAWQRTSLWVAGMFQKAAWSPGLVFSSGRNGIQAVPVGDNHLSASSPSLTFFEDQASMRWRYLEGQYERLALVSEDHDFVVVKKGSSDRYLRVCQWKLGSAHPSFSLASGLIRLAQKERALGVRWAVYGAGETQAALVQRLRRFGFLCARRTRTLLIRSSDEKFFAAENWNLNDAMFSFDP